MRKGRSRRPFLIFVVAPPSLSRALIGVRLGTRARSTLVEEWLVEEHPRLNSRHSRSIEPLLEAVRQSPALRWSQSVEPVDQIRLNNGRGPSDQIRALACKAKHRAPPVGGVGGSGDETLRDQLTDDL